MARTQDLDFLPRELAAPHEPRPIRFLRRERAGAWRLKLYGIALPGQQVRGELADAAMELAPSVLPSPARAWLEHVLDNRDGPDFDRYLGQHHSADL